ncbi:hypothetical protein F909_01322 [Acinetobacter sp. ANC 3929]|nr:hypothetical protein F909_01322 [Acinetobacter sp. ANC 3929]
MFYILFKFFGIDEEKHKFLIFFTNVFGLIFCFVLFCLDCVTSILVVILYINTIVSYIYIVIVSIEIYLIHVTVYLRIL